MNSARSSQWTPSKLSARNWFPSLSTSPTAVWKNQNPSFFLNISKFQGCHGKFSGFYSQAYLKQIWFIIKSKTLALASGLQCAWLCLNEGIQKCACMCVCVCVCVCLPACLGVGGLERPERTREHNAWEDNRGKNVKKKITSQFTQFLM